jgi:hypothetical protein
MDFWLLVLFFIASPALAIYGGHALDETITKANYSRSRSRELLGWAWLTMSAIPFVTGTLILVFVWLPTLPQVSLINRFVPFIFGSMHLILGIVLVLAAMHYFLKK